MVRVLILGATGYIGKQVAAALVRSGQHEVYGLARTEAKAQSIAAGELSPIISPDPVHQPETYLQAVRDHHIDTIVDVTTASLENSAFLDHAKKIGLERRAGESSVGVFGGSKLGFIAVSGTWIHGSSDRATNDLDVVGPGAVIPPAEIITARVAYEKEVLDARDILNVAIVRPALIYGRESSIWTPFVLPVLEAARKGSKDPVHVPLDPDCRPGLIHVDDVAAGFQAAVNQLEMINMGSVYPVFDLVTSQESMPDIFDGFAKSWGSEGGYRLVGAGQDLFAQAMSSSFRGSASRAKQLLGWRPTRLNGFVGNIETYAAAFATQN